MKAAILLGLWMTGCAAQLKPPPPPSPAAPPVASTKTAPSSPKSVVAPTVTFEPSATQGHVRVHVRLPPSGPPVTWTLPEPAAAVTLIRETDHSIAYDVTPTKKSPCPFEVTPNHAMFCGRAVLARPSTGPMRVAVRLGDGDGFYPRRASSFGIGEDVASARLDDIARAGFLFGNVQHAQFDATEGRDHAAWLGYFAFDPRWVAAESAGIRTMADRWLGVRRPKQDPTVGLLLSSVADTSQRIRVRSVHRGALVQAGPSAAWGARSRIDLTRLMLMRTIGGAVSLKHTGAAWWFDEGVAHAAAMRVLHAAGVLSHADLARELNGLLVEQAMSPHASAPLAVVADAANEDVAARRLLAVRGALIAIALERHGRLQAMLQALVASSAENGRLQVATTFFVKGLERYRQNLESGDSIHPSASALGPCFAVAPHQHTPFALGLVVEDDLIATLDPAGPAHRAGLRQGDRVVSLTYVDGHVDVPVHAVVTRVGRRIEVRYAPRAKPIRLSMVRALTTAACR